MASCVGTGRLGALRLRGVAFVDFASLEAMTFLSSRSGRARDSTDGRCGALTLSRRRSRYAAARYAACGRRLGSRRARVRACSAEERPRELQVLGRPVEVFVAAMDPSLAPEEVAAGLRAQHAPVRLLQVSVEVGIARPDPCRVAPRRMHGVAHLRDPRQGLLLLAGAGPLNEPRTVVPAGVPRARSDRDPAVWGVLAQVVGDERRADSAGRV